MAETNRQITLARRPTGYPEPEDFRLVETPVPAPAEGEVLVRTVYLSVDPYQRGLISDREPYADPLPVGGVMVGGVVGKVVESRHPDYSEGEFVNAYIGWQEYGVANASDLRKADPAVAPLSAHLGVIGMPGLTAYFGLLEVGKPAPGETVLVSTAAGAVGSVVGQVAKIKGCRVVGSAGSDAKVRHLADDLGFDAAFNYRTVSDYRAKLREVCPEGIDVYFDNVGGPLTDAVFYEMNDRARIAVCGQISQYNLDQPAQGPRLLSMLIGKGARVEGFLIGQFNDRLDDGVRDLSKWLSEGRLKYRENVVDGLENAPAAFRGLFEGENIGKQLVKVSDPD